MGDDTFGTEPFTDLQNVQFDDENLTTIPFEDYLSNSDNSDSEDYLEEDELSDFEDIKHDEVSSITHILQGLNIPELSEHDVCFKSEETEVINICTDPELKELLVLNRSNNFMLMHMFKKVKDLVVKCRRDIECLYTASQQTTKETMGSFLTRLAAPYFKTKVHMFSCGPNDDILTKRQNGELSFYHNRLSSKWSTSELKQLEEGVLMNYNHNCQKAILKQISFLKAKEVNTDEEINNLNRELDILSNNKDPPVLGQEEFIDWDYISKIFLRGKHLAQECRAMWNIYVHPNINKSEWKKEENEKIKQLVELHHCQDWDTIALELGTNRSGFSTCLHNFISLREYSLGKKFTKEEDDLILDLVGKYQVGYMRPWIAIKQYFPHRNGAQIYQRYKYIVSTTNCLKTSFTAAEKILLYILVDRFGRKYSKFTKYFPHRSVSQLKHQYDNQLKIINHMGIFSLEEDEILMSKTTETFGSLVSVFNRTRSQLRQRYVTLKTFLEKNPTKTLAQAPRRLRLRTDINRKLEFFKCIAELFKDKDIPTLQEIEKHLGVLNKKKHKDKQYNIDIMLTNFFNKSCRLNQNKFVTTINQIQESANNIFTILQKWKVKLTIPHDLKKDHHLDAVDIEILNILKTKFDETESEISPIDDLIPPNINTLVGLKGLLHKNQLYKNSRLHERITLLNNLPLIRNYTDNNISSELIQILRKMDGDKKKRVELERCQFLDRFISLFLWPSLLSIVPPDEKLTNEFLKEFGKKPVRTVNKIHKRPASDNRTKNEPIRKQRKIVKKAESTQSPIPVSSRRSARLEKKFEAQSKNGENVPIARVCSCSKQESNRVANKNVTIKYLKKVDKSEVLRAFNNKIELGKSINVPMPILENQFNVNETDQSQLPKIAVQHAEDLGRSTVTKSTKLPLFTYTKPKPQHITPIVEVVDNLKKTELAKVFKNKIKSPIPSIVGTSNVSEVQNSKEVIKKNLSTAFTIISSSDVIRSDNIKEESISSDVDDEFETKIEKGGATILDFVSYADSIRQRTQDELEIDSAPVKKKTRRKRSIQDDLDKLNNILGQSDDSPILNESETSVVLERRDSNQDVEDLEMLNDILNSDLDPVT